jgi:ATP-dependent DNA ligase
VKNAFADACVFGHGCRFGFEGIVSKRKRSRYQSGRSHDWLKMKNPDAPASQRRDDADPLAIRLQKLKTAG